MYSSSSDITSPGIKDLKGILKKPTEEREKIDEEEENGS